MSLKTRSPTFISGPEKKVRIGSRVPPNGNREWLKHHGIVTEKASLPDPAVSLRGLNTKSYFKKPLVALGAVIICLLPAALFLQQHRLEKKMRVEQLRAVDLSAANEDLREDLNRISKINEVQRAEMQRMVGQFQRTRQDFIEQTQGLEKGEAIANALRHVFETEISRMSDHYDLEVEVLRKQVFQKEQMISSLENSLQAIDGVVVNAEPLSVTDGMTHATVSAVNQDFQFVIVSIGELKGAKLGQMTELYHHGVLIGHGQVEKVYPEFSGVKVFSIEVMAQLQKGDAVLLRAS